jgi:hypothetical protein
MKMAAGDRMLPQIDEVGDFTENHSLDGCEVRLEVSK